VGKPTTPELCTACKQCRDDVADALDAAYQQGQRDAVERCAKVADELSAKAKAVAGECYDTGSEEYGELHEHAANAARTIAGSIRALTIPGEPTGE
jgi:hypothetical protein